MAGRDGYEVATRDGTPLSIYLNWSDLRKNHNKFYIVQVLQRVGQVGEGYHASVFTRYGRVGDGGVTSTVSMSYEAAVKTYLKTTRAKQSKGYSEIKIAAQAERQQGESTKAVVSVQDRTDVPKSKLSEGVQRLIKFFFDMSKIESSMVSVKVDVKKMPLGELSKETVLEGYATLRSIEQAITSGNRQQLELLSSRFYTVIPHNFGRQKLSLFLIHTMEQVREKYDLITNLLDIQVANNILESSRAVAQLDQNPMDKNYAQLWCDIRELGRADAKYQLIERYMRSSQERLCLKIVDCFEVDRHNERAAYNP